MFPLAGNDDPTSSAELAEALHTGLARYLGLAAIQEPVEIIGELSSLQSIQITLDGATIGETKSMPTLAVAGSTHAGFTAEVIGLSAKPLIYRQAKLNLKVSAAESAFAFGRDADGRPLLILTEARSGVAEADISEDDIDAMALIAATTWSKEYGIAVQDVHTVLVSDGPRSITAEVRIKAKKMMMTGVIILRGRVDVSDALVATVSNLSCTGEGMVGSTAAAIVQKKLQPYDGAQIPLARAILGEIKVRDLHIAIDDSLRVSAAFGS